jgi:hypothetical protein
MPAMLLEETIVDFPEDLFKTDKEFKNFAINIAREEHPTWVVPAVWDVWEIENDLDQLFWDHKVYCVTRLSVKK